MSSSLPTLTVHSFSTCTVAPHCQRLAPPLKRVLLSIPTLAKTTVSCPLMRPCAGQGSQHTGPDLVGLAYMHKLCLQNFITRDMKGMCGMFTMPLHRPWVQATAVLRGPLIKPGQESMDRYFSLAVAWQQSERPYWLVGLSLAGSASI